MDMFFKKVERKDLDKLFVLYNELVSECGDFEKMKSVFAKTENDDHYTVFGVYTENDELIATATVSKCLDLTNDALFYYSMENFIVDSRYRRKGVGTFLISELEKFVRLNNGRYISFTSSSVRTEAHKFYEKMGYDPDYAKGFKKVLTNH